MINYGSISHQAKFIETRPILQIGLNLVILSKNDGDFRKKEMFQPGHTLRLGLLGPAVTRAPPPAFPRNPRGRLGFPGPTQGEG